VVGQRSRFQLRDERVARVDVHSAPGRIYPCLVRMLDRDDVKRPDGGTARSSLSEFVEEVEISRERPRSFGLAICQMPVVGGEAARNRAAAARWCGWGEVWGRGDGR
jgi:hypothetical protein